MDVEDFLPFLIAFASLAAFLLGTEVRRRVHVLLPFKDPASVTIMLICFAPALMGYGDKWYSAFLFTFICCYSLAYIRGEFNIIYVNVHTIISEYFPNGAQEVRPIVYYRDRDGILCYQDQSVKEILKTTLFGIHTPLRLNVDGVKRTRPIFVQKILFPQISVDAVDVVEEKFSDEEIKKWKFKFNCRTISFTPAPSCIDSTQGWLVSAYNQQNLTKELSRKEAQLLESKIAGIANFYSRSADLLVELLNDRTPGAEVYREITSELPPEPKEVPVREPRQNPDAPRPRRRSVIPEAEDDDYEEDEDE